MSLFRIVLKNIKQRSLSAFLTAASVMLGVGLVTAILILRQETEEAFNQTATGYEIIVGPKGSSLQLVLNTVYNIGLPIQNMPVSVYELLKNDKRIKLAVPYVSGDNYQGFRVIGTTPDIFSVFEYKKGQKYSFKEGTGFRNDLEAVIGYEAAEKTGLKTGDTFSARHGVEDYAGSHEHEEFKYKVTGVLARTYTPADRNIFCTMNSVWEIHYHETVEEKGIDTSSAVHDGHKHEEGEHHHGEEFDKYKTVTAVLVNLKSPVFFDLLRRQINEDKFQGMNAQAVIPVFEIKQLFDIIGNINSVLLVIAYLVIIVAAVSVLVSIYNSVKERKREIAIMRSLGAKRTTVLSVVLLEGVLLSFAGALAGLILGHISVYLLRDVISPLAGVQISGTSYSIAELYLLGGTVLLGLLAAFVPAITAYKTDAAKNLSPVN